MDPGSFDPEDDAGAMAAAMGFSSFGAQDRPAKKRRYNANSDAVVAGSLPLAPLGSLPPKPPTPARLTGANSLALHQRGPRRGAAETNAEEVDLGEDDDEDQGGVDVGDSGGADGGEGGDDPAPQYIDTSRSPVPYEEPADEIAAYGGYGGGGQRGGRGGFQRGGRGGHGGPGRPQWWLDYYDPTSNENPWEKLEQARGIESKGVWLVRPGQARANVAAVS